MRIAIAGYNGFLGSSLIRQAENTDFIYLSRELLYGETEKLTESLEDVDIVINFAGSSVFRLWTRKAKREILVSRVQLTENLVRAINSCRNKPSMFISGSAVGIYSSEGLHDEESVRYGDNFLSTVVKNWENALLGLDRNVKLAVIRTGIVLGRSGGMFLKISKITSLLPPVIPGSGKQAFPFIHISDFVKGIFWIAEHNLSGIYNFVAPSEVDYNDFIRALGSGMKKKIYFRIRESWIRLILGEMAVLLVEGQRVSPARLLESGFVFNFGFMNIAIENLLEKTK